MAKTTAASERRKRIKDEFFLPDIAWTGENEKGWFRAPRTLPLVLHLLSNKKLTGTIDPTRVYLELLSRHIDHGVVEMVDEGSHAYASGYSGTRAARTWQERMKKLEELGFIKTRKIANQKYRYVLLVHPTEVVESLREKNALDQVWLDTFRARQIEVKEDTIEMKRENRARAEEMKAAANDPF
jgi:hypothetical protein